MPFLTTTDIQNILNAQMGHFASVQGMAQGVAASYGQAPVPGPGGAGGGGPDPRTSVAQGFGAWAVGAGGAAAGVGIAGAGWWGALGGPGKLQYADPFMGTARAMGGAMRAQMTGTAGEGMRTFRGMGAMMRGGESIGPVLARGAGVGLAVGAGYMGATAIGGWALDQMHSGAQQNFMMSGVLGGANRGNMPNMFALGSTPGGLTSAQSVGGVSSMIREMQTSTRSFEQMTGMLGAGIQGGWFSATRNIQEFKGKFKELVETVQTLSTALQSTRDEALQFMQGQKGMGFTGIGGTAAGAIFTGQMAAGAGMQPGQMAQIGLGGANVARQFGGRGATGALMAQQLAAQLGASRLQGVLTDPQLLDITGAGGATGVGRLATQWQATAMRAMRGRRGQRLLTAMMDPETGEIDPGQASAFGSGMMDRRELSQAYRENIRSRDVRYAVRARGQSLAGDVVGAMGPMQAIRGVAEMEYGRHPRGHLPDVQNIIMQGITGTGEQESQAIRQVIARLPSLKGDIQAKWSRALEEGISSSFRGQDLWEKVKQEIYGKHVDKIGGWLKQLGGSIQTSVADWVTGVAQEHMGIGPTFVGPQFRAATQRALYGDVKGAQEMLGTFGGAGGGGGAASGHNIYGGLPWPGEQAGAGVQAGSLGGGGMDLGNLGLGTTVVGGRALGAAGKGVWDVGGRIASPKWGVPRSFLGPTGPARGVGAQVGGRALQLAAAPARGAGWAASGRFLGKAAGRALGPLGLVMAGAEAYESIIQPQFVGELYSRRGAISPVGPRLSEEASENWRVAFAAGMIDPSEMLPGRGGRALLEPGEFATSGGGYPTWASRGRATGQEVGGWTQVPMETVGAGGRGRRIGGPEGFDPYMESSEGTTRGFVHIKTEEMIRVGEMAAMSATAPGKFGRQEIGLEPGDEAALKTLYNENASEIDRIMQEGLGDVSEKDDPVEYARREMLATTEAGEFLAGKAEERRPGLSGKLRRSATGGPSRTKPGGWGGALAIASGGKYRYSSATLRALNTGRLPSKQLSPSQVEENVERAVRASYGGTASSLTGDLRPIITAWAGSVSGAIQGKKGAAGAAALLDQAAKERIRSFRAGRRKSAGIEEGVAAVLPGILRGEPGAGYQEAREAISAFGRAKAAGGDVSLEIRKQMGEAANILSKGSSSREISQMAAWMRTLEVAPEERLGEAFLGPEGLAITQGGLGLQQRKEWEGRLAEDVAKFRRWQWKDPSGRRTMPMLTTIVGAKGKAAFEKYISGVETGSLGKMEEGFGDFTDIAADRIRGPEDAARFLEMAKGMPGVGAGALYASVRRAEIEQTLRDKRLKKQPGRVFEILGGTSAGDELLTQFGQSKGPIADEGTRTVLIAQALREKMPEAEPETIDDLTELLGRKASGEKLSKEEVERISGVMSAEGGAPDVGGERMTGLKVITAFGEKMEDLIPKLESASKNLGKFANLLGG